MNLKTMRIIGAISDFECILIRTKENVFFFDIWVRENATHFMDDSQRYNRPEKLHNMHLERLHQYICQIFHDVIFLRFC